MHIEEAELAKSIDDAYRELRPKLSLPGFRPGKAPLGLIRKMHGEAIEGDTLEELAQKKFQEAVKELDLKPIGVPVMTDLHRHAGEGAHFSVAYEIAPEIVLHDMSDVEVVKDVVTITDEDVEERIHRLLYSEATKEPADQIDGDEYVATVSIKDATAEEGKEAVQNEGLEVYLADPDVLPEIRDALMGKAIDDTVKIELPKTPRRTKGDEEIPVEMGEVEITVTGIQKVVLPELDETLVKKLSRDKFSTPEELRADMKEQLQKHADEHSEEHLEERIVRAFLDHHDFEVPRTISRVVLDQMMEEAKEENTRRGFPANYSIDDKEFDKEMLPIAEARGKWLLLREKLIEDESIEATDIDLEELAEKEAAQYGLPKENLLKYYSKNDSIKSRIVGEKLGGVLRSMVKIAEKQSEKHEH